jgi:hypothetical protein
LESFIENLGAECLHLLLEKVSYLRIRRRSKRRAIEKRVDVEPRPPHDNGNIVACYDCVKRLLGKKRKFGDIEGFMDISNVEQVVRDETPLFGRGLGRANVHLAIDLH